MRLKYEFFNQIKQLPLMPQLLDVSHVSKRGVSLRATIPKKIQEKLGIRDGDIIGFYEENGNIILRKME